MACPGGCVAGAGTIQTVKKAAAALEKMKKEASFTDAYDSKYRARLESLEKFDVEWDSDWISEILYGLQVFECNQYIAEWITRQLSYQSIWIKAGYRLFSGCIHDTTTVCSLELYSYFYYFRCFQSGYGQFSFYSGYGVIFSQDIICAYGICVIGSVSISVQPSLFPFGRLCISFLHFRWQRTALAGITFFLLQYIYG